MKLTLKIFGKGDDPQRLSKLFLKYGLQGPHYASSMAIWEFQYFFNPQGKGWQSVLINQENNEVVGHFGLTPLPLKVNAKRLSASLVSSIVAVEEARKEKLSYLNNNGFAPRVMVEHGCAQAFGNTVELIFAYSKISFSFWKANAFKNLSLEKRIYCHCGIVELFGRYMTHLCQRLPNCSKIVAGSYAVVVTSLQVFLKFIKLPFAFKSSQQIQIEPFDKFDQSLQELVETFLSQHPEVITYSRDCHFMNWRFDNDQYLKFKFYDKTYLIGYCLILKDDRKDKPALSQMVDFIILKEYLNFVPSVLKKLVSKNHLNFEFVHLLSCEYSRQLFLQCEKEGYPFFLKISEILHGRTKKNKEESSFFYKLNPRSSLVKDCEHLFHEARNWFINPLFFGPRYYHQKRR